MGNFKFVANLVGKPLAKIWAALTGAPLDPLEERGLLKADPIAPLAWALGVLNCCAGAFSPVTLVSAQPATTTPRRQTRQERPYGRPKARRNRALQALRTGRSLRVESLEIRQMLSVNWTGGGGDHQFDTAANWSSDIVPGSGDVVTISSGATVNLNVAASVYSVEFLGSATITASSSSDTLTVASGSIIVDTGTASISAVLAGSSQIIVSGAGTLEESGANTNSGGTSVTAGTLVASNNTALPSGSSLLVGADAASIFSGGPGDGGGSFNRTIPTVFAPDTTPDVSAASVIYATGTSLLSASDLGLGITRYYTSRLGAMADGGLGAGWTLAGQPYAVAIGSSTVAVVFSPTQSYLFSVDDGSYTALNGEQETLTADTDDHLLDFTMLDGTVYQFGDFSYSDARAGQLVGIYQPNGSAETVTATDSSASYQISTVQWTVGVSSQPYQTETFTYYTSEEDAENVGRLETIVLAGWNGSEMVDEREVNYAYYVRATRMGCPAICCRPPNRFTLTAGFRWAAITIATRAGRCRWRSRRRRSPTLAASRPRKR
jgi:autotransporter-associated beta strand protein